jgi:hypothetical protein
MGMGVWMEKGMGVGVGVGMGVWMEKGMGVGVGVGVWMGMGDFANRTRIFKWN